jgi:23S rRNA (cytosine1962-C5)-methyltransferase
VYRSDLLPPAQASPGALVHVRDERGRKLGSALYSGASQIAVRLLSSEEITDEALADLLRRRIGNAVDFRRQVAADSDSCRIIFSEADRLPGLMVDKYNDLLVLQALTQALDREDLRQWVVDSLTEHFPAAGIIERVDPHIRELEQLPPRPSQLLRMPHAVVASGAAGTILPGAVPNLAEPDLPPSSALCGIEEQGAERFQTIFTLNGVRFHYDALSGQKTGAFLDQRENYAAAAGYAHGAALDVFTYQGGFALHLARVCDSVTAVDSSRAALEIAEQNERLNRAQHRSGEIEWIEANAFDLLKDYAASGREYDTIVLDPPAFAKTKRALPTALRGYKELNLRALKMLRPGGILVTCSCSFHVSEAEFLEMLASAAADAGRVVRILEKRGAARDHPVLLNVPETSYLKCLICEVEDV